MVGSRDRQAVRGRSQDRLSVAPGPFDLIWGSSPDRRDRHPYRLPQWHHRAELTALERSEQIAEWVELTGEVIGQLAQKPSGGRPEGGISAASRELGIDRTEAQRAVKVASLSPEAKAEAVGCFHGGKNQGEFAPPWREVVRSRLDLWLGRWAGQLMG